MDQKVNDSEQDLLENKIKQACLKMIADGWQIHQHMFLSYAAKKCCPMTALAIVGGNLNPEENAWMQAGLTCVNLAYALHIHTAKIMDFVYGFDGNGFFVKDAEMHSLGKRIREWWIVNGYCTD